MSPALVNVLGQAILAVHLGVIAFNVLGLVAIPLGWALGWRWVRVRWWRVLHIVSWAVVALQASLGRACFLTNWQDDLTGAAGQRPLIERWVDHLIYWPLPIWVFGTIYVVLFAAVLALWWLAPPDKGRPASDITPVGTGPIAQGFSSHGPGAGRIINQANGRLVVAPIRAALGSGDAGGRIIGGMVVAVLFMGSTLLTPLYDLYRATYRFSPLVLVLLYAVYVVGNLAALLLFGRLSDQIGRKPAVLAGLALAGVSTAFFLVGGELGWLFAGRVAIGGAVGVGAGAATAWITEFTPPSKRPGAASTMTAFNFAGLALGPLLAGALVQYAPWPLRLSFAAYLVILAGVAVLAVMTRETLTRRSALSLKPRLGVPKGARLAFIAPAATGFAAMALVGFYAALGPTTIRQDLHIANRAVSGGLVAELFVIACVVIVATRRLGARLAMLTGLAATPVGLALLIVAQRLQSLPALVVGTGVCGVAAALGYRGGLAVANSLAPAQRRAELASAYFLCCFLGNAIPVIGAGALSQVAGARFADLVFAGVVSAIAMAAIAAGLAFGRTAARTGTTP